MPVAVLHDRAVLSVVGADARTFLQNLVTCDVETLASGTAAFGALLTPQGKILFDFLIAGINDETFWLDTSRDHAPALVKRLTMYKLRAKVTVSEEAKQVVAGWGDALPTEGQIFTDPRAPTLGWRAYVERALAPGHPAEYDAHRIGLGIPAGGVDFAWGDAFPHEVNMDLLGGVAFDKGCYVGQEVVSRMQHRGTNRRRVLRATFDGVAPASGTEIRAGGALIGTVGSTSAGHGLVAVRIDRFDEAISAGHVVTAADTPLQIALLS